MIFALIFIYAFVDSRNYWNTKALDNCIYFDAHYFKSGDDPDVYFRGRQPKIPPREEITRIEVERKNYASEMQNEVNEIEVKHDKENKENEDNKDNKENKKAEENKKENIREQDQPSENNNQSNYINYIQYNSDLNTEQVEHEWNQFNFESGTSNEESFCQSSS